LIKRYADDAHREKA